MYRKKVEEVLTELQVDKSKGIKTEEVSARKEKYGPNELSETKKRSLIVSFFSKFLDIMIIILLVAAITSLIVDFKNSLVESIIIFVVVIINAILGVVEESKAEKSLEALKKMSQPKAKVLRDGKLQYIDTRDLVIGDIICFEAGDFFGADARVIEAHDLLVNESSLTGESLAVTKTSEAITGEVSLGDRTNMVFKSTYVTKGSGKAIVTGVGMNTEIGKIAGMIETTKNELTPLQMRLNHVGKIIGIICIVICIIVFGLEYFSGQSNLLESFKSAISLAVAAIPEGLATVVTIMLAIGVTGMSKKNAIIKKLSAVETLGSTNVICTDKTGTLTQNKMTVVKIYYHELKDIKDLDEEECRLVNYFALCSDATLDVGDPTEIALVTLQHKLGLTTSDYERVLEIPFDSDRMLMTTVYRYQGRLISITKGAIDKMELISDMPERVLEVNKTMAQEALRVLTLGYKELKELPQNPLELEQNLTFFGLVGMIDPPKETVHQAILKAKKAGVATVMITGDHLATATAIARSLDILDDQTFAISSDELHKLSDDELTNNIEKYRCYARISPEDKQRIITAWQKKGHIVAMTGDGVNDAPSLKKADIGIAMGIQGTDVSKEAADMILVDDNYDTIITAIKEGRGIYNNIRKCVHYLLSSNIGEVVLIFLASLISLLPSIALGIPLSPIHLLWINLITDLLPAVAIAMNKTSDAVLLEKPRPKNESFFAHHLGLNIFVEGIFIGIITLLAYYIGSKVSHIHGQTMAFLTLSIIELFHSFNCNNDGFFFSKETLKNKYLLLTFVFGFILSVIVLYVPGLNDVIFKFAPLDAKLFFIAIGLAFSLVILTDLYKLILKLIHRKK